MAESELDRNSSKVSPCVLFKGERAVVSVLG